MAALLSLTLGTGANTAVFTLVNAFFLRPLPVAEPERLVALFGTFGGSSSLPISYLDALDYRQEAALSGICLQASLPLSLTSEGKAEQISALAVSANYFDLLGVRLVHGRPFLAEEESPGAGLATVVLAHTLWMQRFGGDPAILGRSITLNHRPFTVVGVAPPHFKGVNRAGEVDAWVPLGMYEALAAPELAALFRQRDGRLLFATGRLAPGVSPAQAGSALATAARRLSGEYATQDAGWGIAVLPLTSFYTRPEQRDLQLRARFLLLTAVALVLLIACVNVANLLLVRAAERSREIAIRLAIGADRPRLFRQSMTEGLLLALVGGLCGTGFAVWGVAFLWRLRPPFFLEHSLDLRLDSRVLLFTLALSLACGLSVGLAPALKALDPDLVSALKEDAARGRKARRGPRLSHLLVLGQIALCLVCLICAGLILRSLREARRIDPGFDTRHLVLTSVDLRAAGYGEAAGRSFEERALARLGSLPGALSASFSRTRLLSGFELLSEVLPEGQAGAPPAGQDRGSLVRTNSVEPAYFATLSVPLLRGRAFLDSDRADTRPVAVVNETFAARFFPGAEALGRRFRLDREPQPIEVVGVARDAKYSALQAPPEPYVYLASRQRYSAGPTFYIRCRENPARLLPAVRRAFAELDPALPLVRLQTIGEQLDSTLWAARLGAGVLSFFGVLALILAIVGIYGVMISSVEQRRSEIGMRMALGAGRRDILLLVLREAAMVVGGGLLLGLGAALLVTRALTGLLYGVGPSDPGTLAGLSILLAAVALVASLLPARRAAAVDPLVAIRRG